MGGVTEPFGKALLCIAEGVHLPAQEQTGLCELAKQGPAVSFWVLQNKDVHVAVAPLSAKNLDGVSFHALNIRAY